MSDARRDAQRRWREANKDKRAEAHRQWRAANLERSRQLNRESEQRRSARRRIQDAKRARERDRYADNRDEMRARARTFREAHPDKIREYHRRWVQKNPERARALSRATGQTYRDRHGDQVRERGRAAAAARRERDPETFKNWYEKNLDAERARGRAASQLRSRLKKLGLPPRRIQRVYAEQKRANEKDATEFFTRNRDATSKRRIADPGQGRLVRERSNAVSRRNLEQREAADNFLLRLPDLVRVERQRHGARVRTEVEMDNTARVLAGKETYDVAREVNRRIVRDVVDKHAPPGAHERVAELGALIRTKHTHGVTVPSTSSTITPMPHAHLVDRTGTEGSGSPEIPQPPTRPPQHRM